jgi:cytochrome c-type biogenesis protein CcmE
MHSALVALALSCAACDREPSRPPPIPIYEMGHFPADLVEPMKIHGAVDPGSIFVRNGGEHWFKLAGNGWKLTVIYGGALPETFRDGVDCVVSGRMRKTEFNELQLVATEIAVKLPGL